MNAAPAITYCPSGYAWGYMPEGECGALADETAPVRNLDVNQTRMACGGDAANAMENRFSRIGARRAAMMSLSLHPEKKLYAATDRTIL